MATGNEMEVGLEDMVMKFLDIEIDIKITIDIEMDNKMEMVTNTDIDIDKTGPRFIKPVHIG